MKGKIGILIAVITYIGIGVLVARFYLPSGNFNVEDIARDSEGNIYAVGETWTGVYVYRLDSGGKPEALYRCHSEAREIQLFCRYEDGRIYVAQMWYEDGKQYFSVWGKDTAEGTFQYIWEKEIAEDVTLTDFQVREGRLYVTGVDQQTENILLYIREGNRDRRVRFETDFIPTTVCWGKDGMYTLSHDNHIYYIVEDGTMERRDLEDIVFFLADENGLYYQARDSRDITYLYENGMGGYTFRDMGDVWNIQYSEKVQNSAVLMSQKDVSHGDMSQGAMSKEAMSKEDRDVLLIVGQDGAYGDAVDCTALGFGRKLRSLWFPFLIYTLAYAAVLIVMVLFWHLVWKPRRLLHQTMAALMGFSGIWLAVTVAGIRVQEIRTEREQQMFLADTCMTIQRERLLDNAEPGQEPVRYENYKGSAQQAFVEGTFSYSVMKNSAQAFYTREELVCNAEDLVFLFSEEAPYGRRADTFYDAPALAKLRECMRTGENQQFIDKVSGISYAMAVSRIGEAESQTCLVSRVPLYGIRGYDMTRFYITAFAGWLSVMLAIALFLRYQWKSIGILCAAMDRVSRGEYAVDSRRAPDNEFGLMWTGLERMCKNLRVQKYRNDETIDYLYQYAPQNFERLFTKEKLQDIEIGETIQMAATLGMISVIDKDTLLTGKLQGQYVQYVNQLMELLFSQKESGQAVFLQDGSNLENVKVIFPGEEQSALTAVKYSLDCMEELLEKIEDTYDTEPFILLHTDQFRCGLAGGSKQVYPYVTSMEMDTLSRYIDDLKRSGARVVVTGHTWELVRRQVQGRRIGYVTAADGKDTFWLYEVLDACPQMQKLGKLKNREHFGEALRLYYNDELYLARNIFTDIVRECPEDGIARWYVFACDERMNRGGSRDEHHELFWKV